MLLCLGGDILDGFRFEIEERRGHGSACFIHLHMDAIKDAGDTSTGDSKVERLFSPD
jgi:hypothetical protein